MKVPLLEEHKFEITLLRLCHQLIENHGNFEESVLIGLQPRGIYVANNLHQKLQSILGKNHIPLGNLDIAFYRDDFRRRDKPIIPNSTEINFIIEKKKVILIDDVLYTGRSVRSGLDALMDYGRPDKVEFLALVDRRYSRQLPIEADYVGISVDTRSHQKVEVEWREIEGQNNVWLFDKEDVKSD